MTAFIKIVATGRGQFPVDMLRFHQAWPARSEDALRISASRDVDTPEQDYVLLTAEEPGYHALQRWKSFGWSARVQPDHSGDEQWKLAARNEREARLRNQRSASAEMLDAALAEPPNTALVKEICS